MNFNELRLDFSIKQKKGLHFILASVIIWSALLIIHLTALPPITKNLLTFFCTAPLMPLALLFSKLIRVTFQDKENPLAKLGILFSLNQMLYLPIAMWAYPTVPDKMLMIMAIIFGAHLLPFGWLYISRAYTALAIAIPILALIAGIYFKPSILALMMLLIEILFCFLLVQENRSNSSSKSGSSDL